MVRRVLQAFDECLRGMKKSGQRLAIIGTALYNIEVVRVRKSNLCACVGGNDPLRCRSNARKRPAPVRSQRPRTNHHPHR